jgi:hypothetical protein
MENNTSKYLKYAFGEIVLVVIGILIALQINNWNEQKSNDLKYIQILNEMRSDLERDIETSSILIKIGDDIDSISSLILDYKLKEQDYRNPKNSYLFYIGLQYHPFDPRKTAFNKFKNSQSVVPTQFNDIFKDINYYYNDLGEVYDKTYTDLRNTIKERNNYLALNFNWYHFLRKDSITDEMIDFYLNNPIYKNWVSLYQASNTIARQGPVHWMHSGAISLLFKINDALENDYQFKNTKILEKFGERLNSDDLNIEGNYQEGENGETFTLKAIGGHLFFNDVYLTMKVDKDTYKFVDFKDNYFKVDRDQFGNVKGLFNIEKDSTKNSYAKKITND